MKKVKGVLVALVVTGLIMVGLSYAQPKIPKKDIPPRIPSDVRRQIEKLYSQDPVERGRAADELGKMGGKAAPAVPFLIGILGDRAELKEGDRSTSPDEKAAGALVKIGRPAVDPLIKALLNDEDWNVRGRAASALGEIKDGRAVNPLIAALKDEDSGVRKGAAEALAKIGRPAVDPLIKALKDKDPSVRWYAASVLGEIKDGRAVNPLIAALKDKGPDVRWSVAEALVKIGRPAVDPLIAALKDKDSDVRRRAAVALGRTGDSRAVDPLIKALKDEDSGVRGYAASALGEIKDSRAADPLIEALKDEDPNVRGNAEKALARIGRPTKGYIINSELIEAAKAGDTAQVKALLDKGANVNAKTDNNEWTVLNLAVVNGHINIVKLLLDRGADANMRPEPQRKPPLVCGTCGPHRDRKNVAGQRR